MKQRQWILVKLGGSLVTDKRRVEHARHDVIGRLAVEIASARKQMSEALVLGHGSGSYGHVAAARYGLGLTQSEATAIEPEGVSVTQDAAAHLHRLLITNLLEAKAHPYSLAPASFLISRGGKPSRGFIDPFLRAVDQGLMPVVFGDVVMDETYGSCICSTEQALFFLIRRLRRRREKIKSLIWLGETRGIYDLKGRTIRQVHTGNYRLVLQGIRPAVGTDVTGGMLLRLTTAWRLARLGIESLILDGGVPGVLESALLGNNELPGTRVIAHGGGR